MKKIRINKSLEEEATIKRDVVDAFQRPLTNSGGWRPSLCGLYFNIFGEDELAKLEVSLSIEEVSTIVRFEWG